MLGPALTPLALKIGTGSGGAVGQWTTSLEGVEVGGWTLSPYRGPLLQPVLGVRTDRWSLGLAPAVTWGRQDLEGADGRVLSLGWTQWRAELRVAWVAGNLRVGLDAALGDGHADLAGSRVADGAPTRSVAPAFAVQHPLADGLGLVARTRWVVDLSPAGGGRAGLESALAVEWAL